MRTSYLLLIAILVGACEPPPPGDGAPAAGEERPQELQDTVHIEGTPEPMTLRLFRSPAGFPLRFSTYVPEDLVPEVVSSGEGDAVRFVAHFGGTRDERATIVFFVHRADATEQGAREMAETIATSQREIVGRKQWHRWSLVERQYRGPGELIGQVIVGRRGDHLFQFTVEHPADMADGFATRTRMIYEHWRWEPENEPLLAGDDPFARMPADTGPQ